jgi:protein TonB
MQQPIHTITQPGARWTNERIVGVGFVGLLHVVAISAILTGLTPRITLPHIVDDHITLVPVDPVQPHPEKRVQKIKDDELPKLIDPVIAPNPVIDIEHDKTDRVQGSTTESPLPPLDADTYASGIAGTHGIPDYPPLARRLGEQGSVRLSLTISATGDVTGATVVQSSGFPDLDQTAVDWVIGHWKYKPATHSGSAVPSQTLAVVVFNLKNAR